MPGARIIDTIRFEVKADFRSGGEPWSFDLAIPPLNVVEEMRLAIQKEPEDAGTSMLACVESLIRPCMGDPEGFEPPVSWDEIKAANDTWYYQLIGDTVGQALKASIGEGVEVRRKNS